MSKPVENQFPRHIGFILDGNRRWAKSKGLPTLEGHRRGYNNMKKIALHAFDSGVEYVSAFIFSTENWSRAEEEVSYLMDLALKIAHNDLKEFEKNNIKIVFLSDLDDPRVSQSIRDAAKETMERTADNTRGTLAICFNYGGYNEITSAVKQIVNEGIKSDDITEQTIEDRLYSPEIPAVDLIIRSSGEMRLSNFMLWRAAYSELYFIDKHWPAFTTEDLDVAIEEFQSRHRRFGGN